MSTTAPTTFNVPYNVSRSAQAQVRPSNAGYTVMSTRVVSIRATREGAASSTLERAMVIHRIATTPSIRERKNEATPTPTSAHCPSFIIRKAKIGSGLDEIRALRLNDRRAGSSSEESPLSAVAKEDLGALREDERVWESLRAKPLWSCGLRCRNKRSLRDGSNRYFPAQEVANRTIKTKLG